MPKESIEVSVTRIVVGQMATILFQTPNGDNLCRIEVEATDDGLRVYAHNQARCNESGLHHKPIFEMLPEVDPAPVDRVKTELEMQDLLESVFGKGNVHVIKGDPFSELLRKPKKSKDN